MRFEDLYEKADDRERRDLYEKADDRERRDQQRRRMGKRIRVRESAEKNYFKTLVPMRGYITGTDEYWDDQVTVYWRVPAKGDRFEFENIEVLPIEYDFYDPETDTSKRVMIRPEDFEEIGRDKDEPGLYPTLIKVYFTPEGKVEHAVIDFATGIHM